LAKGNEGKYIDKVHRQLSKFPQPVYRLKMNMGMGSPSGVPDYYYESGYSILWSEYKVVEDLTRMRKIPIKKLSPHQHNWLERAARNNVNCSVIIGDTNGMGVFLFRNEIFSPPPLTRAIILNAQGIAEQIRTYTCGPLTR